MHKRNGHADKLWRMAKMTSEQIMINEIRKGLVNSRAALKMFIEASDFQLDFMQLDLALEAAQDQLYSIAYKAHEKGLYFLPDDGISSYGDGEWTKN